MKNQVSLIGRLGRDPELKEINKRKVLNLSLATTRNFKKGEEWEQETEWHQVALWGEKGENLAKKLKNAAWKHDVGSDWGPYLKKDLQYTVKVRPAADDPSGAIQELIIYLRDQDIQEGKVIDREFSQRSGIYREAVQMAQEIEQLVIHGCTDEDCL